MRVLTGESECTARMKSAATRIGQMKKRQKDGYARVIGA